MPSINSALSVVSDLSLSSGDPIGTSVATSAVLHSRIPSTSLCHGAKRRRGRQREREKESEKEREKRSEARRFFTAGKKARYRAERMLALTKGPSDRSSVRRVSERRTEKPSGGKRAAEGRVSRRPRVGIPKMARRREPPVTRLFSALSAIYDLSHLPIRRWSAAPRRRSPPSALLGVATARTNGSTPRERVTHRGPWTESKNGPWKRSFTIFFRAREQAFASFTTRLPVASLS